MAAASIGGKGLLLATGGIGLPGPPTKSLRAAMTATAPGTG